MNKNLHLERERMKCKCSQMYKEALTKKLGNDIIFTKQQVEVIVQLKMYIELKYKKINIAKEVGKWSFLQFLLKCLRKKVQISITLVSFLIYNFSKFDKCGPVTNGFKIWTNSISTYNSPVLLYSQTLPQFPATADLNSALIVLSFLHHHINEIFWVRFLQFSMVHLRFVYIVAYLLLHTSFLLLCSTSLNGCTRLFIQSPAEGHLHCFQVVRIMNKAIVNVGLQVPFSIE